MAVNNMFESKATQCLKISQKVSLQTFEFLRHKLQFYPFFAAKIQMEMSSTFPLLRKRNFP